MITISNFQKVLKKLGFIESNKNVLSKSFGTFIECIMEVNFNKGKLIYPHTIKKINDKTILNFEHPENFVVFECVHRLLEKGYRPEHIELEKRWQFGHERKGGKADICVYDETGENMLLIIECKTYGKEYDKALRILKEDGGQLFSYWQQERSTKWISLYSSDWKDDDIIYKNDIICCIDDANIVKMEEKDKTVLLYKKANTVPEYFEAWTETYGQKIWQGLLFGEDTQAYKIGVRPLRKRDLKDFDPDDKIVNRFEEILRHNNVSDKENAFNRLVALFICKLVDEIKKQDDDIVEFQYRQGPDTYETLQDRLQRLHTEGMEEFMGEKIFYVSNDYAENLFKNYTSHKREKAIEDLKNTIRILKFYSNNDFSFKDVHNEELFFQNGKILVEVVQLFENHRIVYPSKHQFLGDLFEQLLNKGFKQSEGQFFTPTPITRFIWDSLPLNEIPKVIDFACGSGHFLTEAVESVNSRLKTDENNTWVEKHIFGIEKDYRLARVSKISLFMNGAGGGNIIFGDGLENQPDKHIENEAFDILVANPPYSIAAFKSHLKLKNNNFELLNRISNDGSEIETLFVERIAQLLKPKGIAAVILPSSILSNDSNSYIGAREILLKNFKLRSIVQFGSKTFGATGTNTVVLFLEKYNEPPKQSDLKHDSANAIIMQSAKTEGWEDEEILQDYLKKINVSSEDYRKFTDESVSFSEFKHCEYLNMYADSFLKLPKTVKKRRSNAFKKLSASEQSEELKREFYSYAKKIEFEKLFYFALTYKQTTLIVIAPSDNAEQKRFLGYDWSNRKGAEGIQITQAGGMLYNDIDHNATDTIAAAIRKRFKEETLSNLGDKQQYCTLANLCDMIDFSRVDFNKAIKLTPDKKIEIKSKYPLVKLGEIAEIISGQSPESRFYNENRQGLQFYQGKKDFGERYLLASNIWTTQITKESVLNDILMSVRAPVGNVNLNPFDRICIGRGLAAIRAKEEIKQEYLFVFIQANQFLFKGKQGMAFDSISRADLSEIKIPLPPLDIQCQIVSECEKIDEEYNTSRMSIEEYKKKIAQVFEKLKVIIKNGGGGRMLKISELCSDIINGGTPLKSVDEYWNSNDIFWFTTPDFDDLSIRINSAKQYVSKKAFEDNKVKIVPINSVLLSCTATLGKTGVVQTELCTNQQINALVCNEKIKPFFMAYYFRYSDFTLEGLTTNPGVQHINIPTLKQIKIPVPPLSEQQRIVEEVESYEAAIAQAKAVMEGCAERKKVILEKWLG